MEPKQNNQRFYIGKDVSLKGTMIFHGTLHIDGNFEGEINTSDTPIVGETGHVKADIKGGIIINRGTVEGTIEARKTISLYSNSVVSGTINTPSLYMEEGAEFQGSCSMLSAEERKPLYLDVDAKLKVVENCPI